MIPILYEKTETEFTSNGLGRLYDVVSCIVTEERNGIYECDFEYPVTGINYEKITPGRIIACEHDYSDDVQPFDIVSYSKPINGIVKFHAVHISYRQSEITVSGKDIEYLSEAFSKLKEGEPRNPFVYSTNLNNNVYVAAFDGVPRTVRQLLGGCKGSILDSAGGEFRFNKFSVELLAERGRNASFSIRYGFNLIDYNDEGDYSESFTSCVPFWVGSDGDEEVIVQGSRVDTTLKSYNDRNICVPLDLSDSFENKPTLAELELAAATYMYSNKVNVATRSISVNFVNVKDSASQNYSKLLDCGLCDNVNVIFPQYAAEERFKIVKVVYNVLLEKYDSMELGTLSTTLAEALGISGDGPSPTKESVVKNITRDSIGGARDITATTRTLVKTINHTSATGRVRVFVNHGFYTSRFTSSAQLVVNGTQVSSQRTNVNPNPNTSVCDRITHYAIVDVPKNQPSKFEYYLQGQDSGTTATIPAYKDGAFVIEDI